MTFYPPTLTVAEIAERWAEEKDTSFGDMVRLITSAVVAGDSPEADQLTQRDQALVPYPTICFDSLGHFDRFRLKRIYTQEKRSWESEAWPKTAVTILWSAADVHGWKNPEDNVYWRRFVREIFSEIPLQESQEVKEYLRGFSIRRTDFEKWCQTAGEPLPRFWFAQKPTAQELAERGRVSGKNQEDVAEEIMSLYPDTSREDLGRLVPAKWTTKYRHEQSAAAIQQGKRLWRKIQQKDQHN